MACRTDCSAFKRAPFFGMGHKVSSVLLPIKSTVFVYGQSEQAAILAGFIFISLSDLYPDKDGGSHLFGHWPGFGHHFYQLHMARIDILAELLETRIFASRMSLHPLQVLVGHFNFACGVIAPGRAFLSRLCGAMAALTLHNTTWGLPFHALNYFPEWISMKWKTVWQGILSLLAPCFLVPSAFFSKPMIILALFWMNPKIFTFISSIIQLVLI